MAPPVNNVAPQPQTHAVTGVRGESSSAGPPQAGTAPSGGSAAHAVASVGACICLAGPTASGKTAAALAIAQAFEAEIISVDSALVYRGMDIGTAKPSTQELAAVPHHLIDIREPLNAYSAAEFVSDARRLIGEISARGRVPLLVGGTMLYFKSLFGGLDDMPGANPAVRARIEAQAAQSGWPALHAELAAVDPVTAKRLSPADTQRISRALEVFHLSGQPLSSFHTTKLIADNSYATGARGEKHHRFFNNSHLLVSLEPRERPWLHARIAQRFDAMLAQGFVDEVVALRARADLSADLPSMRCVGYRQAWQALDGLWPMSELRDKGIFATRQLAKRQLTWLRSMPERQVVPADDPHALQTVLDLAADFLKGHQ